MSLLIVNYEYPPIGAGAANASFYLAQALTRRRQEVVVLTSGYGNLRGYTREGGVHIYRLRTRRSLPDRSNLGEMGLFLAAALCAAPGLARRHRLGKAIVFFTLPCGPVGYALKHSRQIPYVISLRGGDVPGLVPELDSIHRLITPLRRLVLREARHLVANAPGLAALSYQADPFPVNVIPNGVEADFFRPGPQFAAGNPVFPFLFVGRFQPQKNLFFLLARFRELQDASHRPFHLHLVGDGPLKGDLQQYAVRLGLQDRITWHGWLDKGTLRVVYQSCGCFINPSLYEGLPNTVLEAMASGLPVVASRIPGNYDLVKPGETGYLISISNPEEFTLALQDVLDHPEQAESLGKAGRELVLRDFSWDRVALEYLNLFPG